MSEAEISESNSKKLDRVIVLLEGDGESVPGVLRKIAKHEDVLFGKSGGPGLVSKVSIMWRIHIWLLCSLSGALGYLLKSATEKLLKP